MDDPDIATAFTQWADAEIAINQPGNERACEPEPDEHDGHSGWSALAGSRAESAREHDTDRRCDVAAATARHLASIPATTLTGFVLKTVASLLYDPPLPAAVDMTTQAVLDRALLTDAVRLVPELQHVPIVARYGPYSGG